MKHIRRWMTNICAGSCGGIVRFSALFAQRRYRTIFAVFCTAVLGVGVTLKCVDAQARVTRMRVTFSHDLPQLEGNHLKATIVEVTYAPGESSPVHSHPCPVIGYVVKGTLRIHVKGQSEAVYKAGESFYESPNGIHLISANASNEKPAKLLAYFLCDHDTQLTVAPPQSKISGGNDGK